MGSRFAVDWFAVGLGAVFAAVAAAGLWWLGPYASRAFPLIVGWIVLYFLLVRWLKGKGDAGTTGDDGAG